MVGKTNVAGARLRAVIAVTYPEGSVCTCVSGAKTLKAKDTSGKALFNVTVGEWTVTATDGSSTKSASVSITAEGQSENVTLRYALVLFDNGSYADETGGWTDIENNTLYKSVYGGSSDQDTLGYLSTVNSINLSDYSTLYFVVSSFNSANGLTIGVSPTKGTADDFSAAYEFKEWQSSSDETVYSVNISSVSSGYIKARLAGYNGNTSEIRMTKVYAE